MKILKIVLSCLFFLTLAIDIYATPNQHEIRVITKPLLMPILLLLYLCSSNRYTVNRACIISALLFSLLGDILLLSKSDFHFILGIASFLLAQICYIIYFLNEIKGAKIRPLILPFLVFLLLFLGVIYTHIFKTDGDKLFLAPISLYAIVITIMTYFAALRSKTPRRAYFLVLIGSILFLISDSCIAINSFLLNKQIDTLGKFVMLSYGFAQYLIIRGVTIRAKNSRL